MFDRVNLRHLAAALACLLLCLLGASSAAATTIGVVPPHEPSADCAHSQFVSWTVANIDACRAKEGVGALRLPSNWSSLNANRQMFVLIDLERVNRGLRPIVGLSRSLNALAQQGANTASDPSFPGAGFVGGGAIWAGGASVIGADDGWMYDDGPHGLDLNLDCPTPGASGCWGHRDVILMHKPAGALVAGAGSSNAPGYESLAFEVLAGYSTKDLTFTWAHELHYFAATPKLEPLHGVIARAKHKHKKKKSTSVGITITAS